MPKGKAEEEEASVEPPRYSAVYACSKCDASLPITADQGAHAVECFSCGEINHVFVGPAANLQMPVELSEEK